jgi:UDP-2,3-diacylglucosamine pyrophosphatase LpxH
MLHPVIRIQKEQVFIVGDIHGRWHLIQEYIQEHQLRNAALLQVGDFGVGFRPAAIELELLVGLNHLLGSRDIHLLCIRGNHDDPSWFYQQGSRFSHIRFLADYTLIHVNEQRILVAGGAISINRKQRQEGVDFWAEARFRRLPEHLDEVSGVTVVLTHSAPGFAFPPGYGPRVVPLLDEDPQLAADLLQEREEVSQLYRQLAKRNTIRQWFYGHFHQHAVATYKQTEFVLLDIGQFYRVYW